MATFTEEDNRDHRKEFIRESRQKAWGAACHAEYIAKQLDEIAAEYKKLQDEDHAVHNELKKANGALDSHTEENQKKRETLRERRKAIQASCDALKRQIEQGQRALVQVYNNVEINLALAKHAETWKWKESAASDNMDQSLT